MHTGINRNLKRLLFSLLALFFIWTKGASQNNTYAITHLLKLSDSIVHSDVKAAKTAAEEALNLSIKQKNDTLEYLSRFSFGIASYYMGDLNTALDAFIKNKELAKKINSPKRVIESLNAIGNVYKDIDRYDLSLKTYQEALEITVATKNTSKNYLLESNVAMVYNQLKKFDSSNYYCYRLLKNLPKEVFNNKLFVSSIYGTMSANYVELKKSDSVKKYTDLALELKLAAGDSLGYAGYLYNTGTYYYNILDYKTAEQYLIKAYAVKHHNIELELDVANCYAKLLYDQQRYKEAAVLYRDCIILRDSMNKFQTIDKLSEMEVKYETGKKEEELKRLGAEKEVTDLKAKHSQIWLIASFIGILFVVVVAIVLFKQNKNRQEANKLLQHQNDEIILQKKEITDSINYAKRIQLAILPPDKMVQRLLPNAFVLYKPKDVVSGDFYWMEEKNGKIMFAAVDCTGHGVPGAMMSVVGLNLLNQAVKEKGLTTPSEILQHLDTGVTDTLRQSADKDSIKDGMDLSLCSYDPKTLELQYAGAFNNLWVVRNNISSSYQPKNKNELFFEEHLLEIKADKFPIGSNLDGVADNYTNHKLQLQKGDCVYLYSDGFADQFGGPKGKKFKYNALKKFLVSVHHLPPEEQREKLLSAFENWRGNLEQVDDILVIGVCV
jgi:serine phosphatase RsbU (regulator of sigma subunit)